MSIRLRLTLWYASVMAVTLIGASIALYLVLAFSVLQPTLDQLLASKGNELAGALARRAAQPPPPGVPRRGLLPQFLNRLAEGDISIAIRDADGQTTERSSNLGDDDLPLTDAALSAARRGSPSYEYVSLEDVRLRLYTVPIIANDDFLGLVQVARPTRQMDETLNGLRNTLLIGDSILLVVGAAVGWFLAGRSLEPVRRITQTARDIETSGQLDRRVFYRGPRDELGELAIAFNRMLGRLEALFNAQRRFVTDASHELRTPLTTLRVNLEVLRKEVRTLPRLWAEVLDDMHLELVRMTRLVEGMLELARADAGQHLERTRLELDPLIERAYRLASQAAQEVKLSLHGEPVGPVLGNADALSQLFTILLDNAVKYTPAGGQVTIERRRENGAVTVKVSDTGPGIAPSDLPRIFDRFYRAPTMRGRSGTGLGLAIARWIAEEHGGEITVQSTPGQGSTFTVRLPAPAGS